MATAPNQAKAIFIYKGNDEYSPGQGGQRFKDFMKQESLKAAVKQAEDRLEEDKTAVKAQKRETKVCI